MGMNNSRYSNKKKEIIKKYNSSSSFYDSRYRQIQETKYHIILKNFDLTRKVILDLGCGTGLFIEYLSRRKLEQKKNLDYYVGLDISWNMLLEFRSKFEKLKGKNISLLLSDIENLPFRDNQFFSVLSLTSFQNLPDVKKGIKELLRVSRNRADFKFSILKKKINLKILVDFLKSFVVIDQVLNKENLEDVIIQGKIFKRNK